MVTESDSKEIILGDNREIYYYVRDEAGVPVNVATWAMSWMLKRHSDDLDVDKLLEKTTAGSGGITVVGSYNADPAISTQKVVVALADTDTDALVEGLAFAALKRTDAGFESTLRREELELVRGEFRT